MKTLLLILCTFALTACNDEKKATPQSPQNGSADRKLSDNELIKLVEINEVINDLDISQYPIDRAFGQEPEERNTAGDKMFEKLKKCEISDKFDGTTLDRKINGNHCPIDYQDMAQAVTEQASKTSGVYSIIDENYRLAGSLLKWQMNGESKAIPNGIGSINSYDFISYSYGEGLLKNYDSLTGQAIDQSSFFFTLTLKKVLRLSSRSSEIDLTEVVKGKGMFVKRPDGSEDIDLIPDSQSCYLDNAQFNCESSLVKLPIHNQKIEKMLLQFSRYNL